jgi:hypothetical protein
MSLNYHPSPLPHLPFKAYNPPLKPMSNVSQLPRSRVSPSTKSARELYEDRDTTTGTSEDDDSEDEVDEIEYVFPDEDTEGFVHIMEHRDLQVGYSTKTKEQDLKVYSKFVGYLKKRKTYDKRKPLTITPEAMYCFIKNVMTDSKEHFEATREHSTTEKSIKDRYIPSLKRTAKNEHIAANTLFVPALWDGRVRVRGLG